MSSVLFFHVCAGTIVLLSGALAMVFRKGSGLHRAAGDIFVISMLVVSSSGTYVGFMRHQTLNGLIGVLTFYLVTTAWLTARRRDGKAAIFDWGALMVPLAVGAALVAYGLEAANSPTGLKDKYPAAAYFLFGSLALLLAAGDVRMLVRGGIFGAHRIARHLWRMCLALLVAANFLFMGQAKVFPESLQNTHLLLAPGLVILVLMVYWLLRVLFPKLIVSSAKVLPRRSSRPKPRAVDGRNRGAQALGGLGGPAKGLFRQGRPVAQARTSTHSRLSVDTSSVGASSRRSGDSAICANDNFTSCW